MIDIKDPAIQEILQRADSVRYDQPCASDVPPTYPQSFLQDFVLPSHFEKSLHKRFRSERDQDIVFHETPHIYVVKGRAYDCSVTTLTKKHSEDFNPTLCIARMRKSRTKPWPRFEYSIDPFELEDSMELSKLVETYPMHLYMITAGTGNECIASQPMNKSFPESVRTVLNLKEHYAGKSQRTTSEELRVFLTPGGMTDEQILKKWELNGEDSRNRGTWIHWQLELWSNGNACHFDKEMLHGLRFVANILAPMSVRCYGTEYEIYGEEEEVSGSIDFLGHLESNENDLVIVDWKRSKGLANNLTSSFHKRMMPPLDHLDDTDGAKYCLQLSCYAFILEKYYGKRIRSLILCCVHDDAPMHTFVPYLRAETAYLMAERRKIVNARRRAELEAPDTIPRCQLTQAILYDGCRLSDGRLANRKDAAIQFPNEKFASAFTETDMAQQYTKRFMTEGPTKEEQTLATTRVAWSRLMPESGIPSPLDVSR